MKAFMDYKERSTVWKTDHVLAVCDGITRASGLEYIFTRKCPLPLTRNRQQHHFMKTVSTASDRGGAACYPFHRRDHRRGHQQIRQEVKEQREPHEKRE